MKTKENRELRDLVSVGKTTVSDFELLEITTVEELIGKDANKLFQNLCLKTGFTHDPCVIDVFSGSLEESVRSSRSQYK